MMWEESWRADPRSRELADRHYNRQKVGAKQFVPPGRCFVLFTKTASGRAFWITSWPFAEYVKHEWAGAWVCSAFRNEGAALSSALILEAVAATRWRWPEVPELGMITFVDAGKVRRKRDPGRCYVRAGFELCGKTKGGLLAFQLKPGAMPPPSPPILRQSTLDFSALPETKPAESEISICKKRSHVRDPSVGWAKMGLCPGCGAVPDYGHLCEGLK